MKRFLLFLFIVSPLFADNTIFVLHSYHEAYPWTKSQRIGFRTVLNHTENLYPLYSVEYLDTKRRNFDEAYEKDFVDYLRSKYKGYHPKLIYVTDDNALHFMLHNKNTLFPSVPVIFSGINDFSKQDLLSGSDYRGIFEKKELLPNLQLIKTLFPDEKKVLIIGDGTETAQITQNEILHDARNAQTVPIEFANDHNFSSILDQIKRYQGKTLILMSIGGFRAPNGELMHLNHVIRQILGSGKFVAFTLEDNYIQEGVVGGYVVDGLEQGKSAGELALKLLCDPHTPPSENRTDTNRWIFDTQALKRNDITLPDTIAAQSTYLNIPDTFFQKHQEFLVNLLYGLSGVLLVGILYFNRYLYLSRKSINERKQHLLKITESLNSAQAVAHLGNWEWDIKGGTLWWSNEIYRIFGLPPQQFEPTYEAFLDHIHPDDRMMVVEAVDYSLKRSDKYRVEHRILRPDGTLRHVIEEGDTERDDLGNPIRMVGIIRDITEEKAIRQALEESEKKYKSLVENATIGIYRTHLSGTILYVNPALVKMFGCDSVEELIGQSAFKLYDSTEQRDMFIHKLQEAGYINNYEIEAHDKNGFPIPIMLSANLDGDILSGMMIDMREIKKSREEIDKFSKAMEEIDDTVAITDKYGVITYVNQAFIRHTGYTKEEALGQTSKILKSGQHDQSFYQNLWKTILEGNVFRGTLINRKKNGEIYYENKTITPLKDRYNNVTGFVTTGKDVTLEKLMHQDMERIATTDKLTGVYNRHKFEEMFALESERSRRFLQPLSLILIDIDHFKSVNDTYGHDIGDEVLKTLADTLQRNIRKIDILARWGGEEFLILSPTTDLIKIQMQADKLRSTVENTSFPTLSRVTISLGVSTLREKDTFSELFKRADRGLYHAKREGRNRVGVVD